MDRLIVDERITRRHHELSDEDVTAAMRQMVAYKQRATGEWLAVGIDSRGRLLELVYLFYPEEGAFYMFHAMTPPSRKTLKELRIERS